MDLTRRSGQATGPATGQVRIESATERDVPLILEMIRGLAEYEKLAHVVVADETGLREALFGPRPAAEVIILHVDDQPAGFALFFFTFSTFLGQRTLYLEDLFVKPQWRRRGLGKRLLVELARIAAERGCGRFEWAVLDWNAPAIEFYRRLGAQPMDDWTIYRLTGDALRRLASAMS